ncbi:MAG: hypothetical protein N2691_05730 [Patescibacteria group bacterium]|nr:hypothetical protein [Patescibacteria group bacterium]
MGEFLRYRGAEYLRDLNNTYALVEEHRRQAREFAVAAGTYRDAYIPEGVRGLRLTLLSAIDLIAEALRPPFKLGYASMYYERLLAYRRSDPASGNNINIGRIAVNEADSLRNWGENPAKVGEGNRKITRTFRYPGSRSFLGALEAMRLNGPRIVESIRSGQHITEDPPCIAFSASSAIAHLGGRLYGGRYCINGFDRVMLSIPYIEGREEHDMLDNYITWLQSVQEVDTDSPDAAFRYFRMQKLFIIDAAGELFHPAYNTCYPVLQLPGAQIAETIHGEDPHTGEYAEAVLQIGGFETVPEMGDPNHHVLVHEGRANAGAIMRILDACTEAERRKKRLILSDAQREKISHYYLGAWAHRLLNMLTYEKSARLVDKTVEVLKAMATNFDPTVVLSAAKSARFPPTGTPNTLVIHSEDILNRYGAVFLEYFELLHQRTGFDMANREGNARELTKEFLQLAKEEIDKEYNEPSPLYVRLLLERFLLSYHQKMIMQQIELYTAMLSSRQSAASGMQSELAGTLYQMESGINLTSLEVMSLEALLDSIQAVSRTFEGSRVAFNIEDVASDIQIEAMRPILSRWVEVVTHNAAKYGLPNDQQIVEIRVSAENEGAYTHIRFVNKGQMAEADFKQAEAKAMAISRQTEEKTTSADAEGGHGVGTMYVRVLVDAMYTNPDHWNTNCQSEHCWYEIREIKRDGGMVEFEFIAHLRLRNAT